MCFVGIVMGLQGASKSIGVSKRFARYIYIYMRVCIFKDEPL